MEDIWINIISVGQQYIAEMAKDILYQEGIASVIVNKQDSTYLFGDIEIYVDREYAIRAKHILEKANIT